MKTIQEALQWNVAILNKQEVPFQIVGGLGGEGDGRCPDLMMLNCIQYSQAISTTTHETT